MATISISAAAFAAIAGDGGALRVNAQAGLCPIRMC
jgi:hypothetical protein